MAATSKESAECSPAALYFIYWPTRLALLGGNVDAADVGPATSNLYAFSWQRLAAKARTMKTSTTVPPHYAMRQPLLSKGSTVT